MTLPDGRGMAWSDAAPALDAALDARYQGRSSATLGGWTDGAYAAMVLSFRQSAELATSFLERYGSEVAGLVGHAPASTSARRWAAELWSLKEGHTSSVWRVELTDAGSGRAVAFGLNVPRDGTAAAAELVASTDVMVRAWQLDPSGVVRVLRRETVDIRLGRRRVRLPLVAVEWLEGAVELHLVQRSTDEAPRFICVEAFLPDQRMFGTVLDQYATDRVWREIVRRQVLQTTFVDLHTALPCRSEINEGDWVLHQGDVVLVGASHLGPPVAIGDWVADLLLISSQVPNSDGRRLYWADSEAALGAVRAGLAARGRPGPPFNSAIRDATQGIESGHRGRTSEERAILGDALAYMRRALREVDDA